MIALALLLSLPVSAAPSAVPSFPAALPPSEPQEAVRAAERDALRALAALAGGEPGIAEVQQAASRAALGDGGEPGGLVRRARLASLLPRITAEVRLDDQSTRVVGLQGSGEVDYMRLAPGSAFVVRATWELGDLVAARGELAAASAEGERARRRSEAVRRATALFYERRRAQLALLLAPPDSALARAEAELEVDRLAAELDALTGGLVSGRRR
jgi:hypothetical protein